jgi:hypothetical protein
MFSGILLFLVKQNIIMFNVRIIVVVDTGEGY